jgi:hypothetical protein
MPEKQPPINNPASVIETMTNAAGKYYTKTEIPLTEADSEVLKKSISVSYKINIVLVPLMALIFFWGMLYFIIFFVFTVLCNILVIRKAMKEEENLARPKIVFTGTITNTVKRPVEDGYDTIAFMGPEEFNITYANPYIELAAGDTASLHYSQKENGQKGMLIAVDRIC